MSYLKMGELMFESLPQLITQQVVVRLEITYKKMDVNTTRFLLQCLSIASSSITIVIGVVKFIVHHRRSYWILPGYPAAASVLALFSLTLAALLSGSFFLPSLISMSFTIWGISQPCNSKCYRGCCCRCLHTCVFALLVGTAAFFGVSLIYLGVYSKYDLVNLIPLTLHFLLGIAVFSGLNYAEFFAPIVFALVSFVRGIVNCFCCFCGKWKKSIHQMLDEVVKVETENQLVGRALEEGAGEEEVLDLQVVSSATKNTKNTRHTI